jgi:hypothetical protein
MCRSRLIGHVVAATSLVFGAHAVPTGAAQSASPIAKASAVATVPKVSVRMATNKDPPLLQFTSDREMIGALGIGPVITGAGGAAAGLTVLAADAIYMVVTLPLTVAVMDQLEASRRNALVAQVRRAEVIRLTEASLKATLAASGAPIDPEDSTEVIVGGYGFTMSGMEQACVMMAAQVTRQRHGVALPVATVAIGAPFEPGGSGGVFCSSPRRLLAGDTARVALEDAARTLGVLVARYLLTSNPPP